MKSIHLHPPSLLAGCGLALLAFVALGQKATTPQPGLEFRIVDDVEEEDLGKLASEGWDFAGYVGQEGSGNDQTIWKRLVK